MAHVPHTTTLLPYAAAAHCNTWLPAGYSFMFDKHKPPEFLYTVVPTWVPPDQFPVPELSPSNGGQNQHGAPSTDGGGTTLFLVPDAAEHKSVGTMCQSLAQLKAFTLCFLRKLRWVV